MNKKTVIGLLVVIALLLAWWFTASKTVVPPSDITVTTTGADGATYGQELEGLNDAGLGAEMQNLDAGINKL